jgi:hypothetical protein
VNESGGALKLGGALDVLYNFEHWFLTLQGEHMLRMFINRMLRRIFGLEREKEQEAG